MRWRGGGIEVEEGKGGRGGREGGEWEERRGGERRGGIEVEGGEWEERE